VAAGLARIPTVTGLGIYDEDTVDQMRRRRAGYLEQANSDEALVKNMLIPSTWAKSGINQGEQPPVEMLTKLLGAAYDAGVLLKTLYIEVSAPKDYSVLASSENDLLKVTAVMRKLKTFLFCPRYSEIRAPIARPRGLAGLGRFLKAILETDSLEDMTLDFRWMWNDRVPRSVSVGSIITSQQWPNLRYIRFYSLPLHLAELQRFIENLKKPLKYSHMSNLRLLSGTWEEGLDMLHNEATRRTHFASPSGGECDSLSKEEKKAIFETDPKRYCDTSQAEKYIRGWVKNNPLRDGSTEERNHPNEV